jgi:hypothetical protein
MPESDDGAQNANPNSEYKVGYRKPPKHSQFPKGTSGYPSGRPKSPDGVSLKEIFDGQQPAKNGKTVSRREAMVYAIIQEALKGNQKAFRNFMRLMNRSGLIRAEKTTGPSVIHAPERIGTKEEYEQWKRNFGRPREEWDK